MKLAIWYILVTAASFLLIKAFEIDAPLVHQFAGGIYMMTLMMWVYGYRKPGLPAHNGGEG